MEIDNKRFWIVIGIVVIMWLGIMIFFYLKADEVTRDPCSICSEKMGDKVICTLTGFTPLTRVYYPNGSVEQEEPFEESNLNNYSLGLK